MRLVILIASCLVSLTAMGSQTTGSQVDVTVTKPAAEKSKPKLDVIFQPRAASSATHETMFIYVDREAGIEIPASTGAANSVYWENVRVADDKANTWVCHGRQCEGWSSAK